MTFNFRHFELVFWMMVPALLSILLLVICLIPKHVWGVSYVVPLLPIMPIFYWGRMQTKEIPYVFVVFIGLLTDAVGSAPLGLSALLYLVFIATLHAQGKYIKKEAFAVIWGYFIMLLAMISASQWIIMSFLAGKIYAITPALIQLLFTASIYPLFHAMFDVLYEFIKHRRWAINHG